MKYSKKKTEKNNKKFLGICPACNWEVYSDDVFVGYEGEIYHSDCYYLLTTDTHEEELNFE